MNKADGFPEMTEEQKVRLKALAELPDDPIDTLEIPEWTEEDFKRAVPFSSLYRPRKAQITTRIDADILVWLKSHGRGYQTLLNELLRKEMNEERKGRVG